MVLEIKKNLFNKLPQIDRIEYRQKSMIILEKYQYNYIFFILCMFVVVLNGVIPCSCFIWVAIACFTLAILEYWVLEYLRLEDIKSLEEDYFTIQIKKRRGS